MRSRKSVGSGMGRSASKSFRLFLFVSGISARCQVDDLRREQAERTTAECGTEASGARHWRRFCVSDETPNARIDDTPTDRRQRRSSTSWKHFTIIGGLAPCPGTRSSSVSSREAVLEPAQSPASRDGDPGAPPAPGDRHWISTTSGSWDVASNWSNGVPVPTTTWSSTSRMPARP